MRILLIVHGLPPACSGGTETYTLELARALARRPGLRVGIVGREADPVRPELNVRFEQRGDLDVWFVNNTFQSCAGFEETYRHPALCAAVLRSVEAFDPDVVHIQHLTALSTNLPEAFATRGVPVVMTLNDYWPICHRGQLLDAHGQRCDGPGADGCEACIPAELLAPPAMWRRMRSLRERGFVRMAATTGRRLTANRSTKTMSARRAQQMRDMLRCASVLLAPSETLRERYRVFGIDETRLVPHVQGIAYAGAVPRSSPHAPGRPLRVLFAGSLMQSKAPALILDAIDLLPDGAAQVDFVGTVTPYHGDGAYSDALIGALGGRVVRRHGPAPHARVVDAMLDSDVVVVPSIWIENAPFVIKEAFACGVPVVASRLGGMAELVRDGVDGMLFTPGDARSLADVLRRLSEEPGLLESLRRGITPPRTIESEAADLEALYGRLANASRRRSAAPLKTAQQDNAALPIVAAVVLNYRTPEETFLAARSVQRSRYPAEVIVVDNGSRDEATLRTLLPEVEVLATARNLGFSGGCNVGIRRALERGADAVLLFNSDAILHADALTLLVEALRRLPRAGIAAPVLLAATDPARISSAGISYDASTGRMRHHAFGQRRSALGTQPVVDVDAASGCALLVRRHVFERCGLLDEPYFFSFEDVEFCLRARAAGFSTVSVRAASVLHSGSASLGARSPRRIYYGVRNHLRLAQQVAPRSVVARLLRTAVILGYNAAYVMTAADVPLVAGTAALTRGAVDHFRGRYGD